MAFVRSKLAYMACRVPLSAKADRPAGPQGRISRSNPEQSTRAPLNGAWLLPPLCKILEPEANLATHLIKILHT